MAKRPQARTPLTNISNIPGIIRSAKKEAKAVAPLPPTTPDVEVEKFVMEIEDDILPDSDDFEIVEDIDQSFDDAQSVSEYAQEIYEYSLQKEVRSSF